MLEVFLHRIVRIVGVMFKERVFKISLGENVWGFTKIDYLPQGQYGKLVTVKKIRRFSSSSEFLGLPPPSVS